MWGDGGGRLYWGSKSGRKVEGIVVIFAWVSIHERHLENYVDLYSSLGWDSLVCHADFLNANYGFVDHQPTLKCTPVLKHSSLSFRFVPEKATSLAFVVLNELVEELRIRPCPIVFVAFSGGPKACMYKVFQIIEGTCEAQFNLDDHRLVRNCISGHIYDSGPVDFTSDLGARFALPPTVLKLPGSSKLVSWVAKGVTSGLDALYLTRFESQRTEYWHTLYSSVGLGAPFLILCSENDDLAPYQIICNFTQRLQDLGGDVELVKWNGSPHVGHYKHYPIQYKASVMKLLVKAAAVYSERIQQLEGERTGMEGTHDEMSELICNLQKAAVDSNQSLRRVAIEPSDHFFLPSSSEYHNERDKSLQDERKERLIHLQNPPSISAHSVLGQVLFDVCVPKNVEGWDIKFSGSLNGQPFASARKRWPLHGMKCIRRSRL